MLKSIVTFFTLMAIELSPSFAMKYLKYLCYFQFSSEKKTNIQNVKQNQFSKFVTLLQNSSCTQPIAGIISFLYGDVPKMEVLCTEEEGAGNLPKIGGQFHFYIFLFADFLSKIVFPSPYVTISILLLYRFQLWPSDLEICLIPPPRRGVDLSLNKCGYESHGK